MLEGKEVDVKLGSIGNLSVDVTPDLHLDVQVGVKIDLLAELKKLAAKTQTPLDDTAIAWVERVLAAAKA